MELLGSLVIPTQQQQQAGHYWPTVPSNTSAVTQSEMDPTRRAQLIKRRAVAKAHLRVCNLHW